jgi:D-alanyl-D-alanine carboxypeptidase (penicillin-binding protein 5/6)
MTKLRWLLAAASFCLAVSAAFAAKSAARPPYLGAITVDADSGQVLFADNADVVSAPASMTKLMTFAVLHDRLAAGTITLDTAVTVTAADSRIGGTQVWLKENESFRVEDLIYAMMIQSANDAAYALARASAGTTDAFVELMNAKARALGMTHTTFRTPHGLPPVGRRLADGDLTTPRDYATLARYLLLETDIVKYTSVRERKFGENVRPANTVIDMRNHNNLLGKVAGVNGLKTGFTNGAGYCLAASAERNGRHVIVVVMGSPDSRTRDLRTIEFLERGFAAPLDKPGALSPSKGLPVSLPAAQPVATAGGPPIAPAKTAPAEMLTVKTDKAATPAAEQSSTAQDEVITFRVIPPEKKP